MLNLKDFCKNCNRKLSLVLTFCHNDKMPVLTALRCDGDGRFLFFSARHAHLATQVAVAVTVGTALSAYKVI